uniref:Uncharacterized protein n=1 Tax=Arundo donax TaxID=35708 RepID=A0A0A9CLX0_ARUDO
MSKSQPNVSYSECFKPEKLFLKEAAKCFIYFISQ